MILAGRRINDNMPTYIVSRIVKLMIGKEMQPKGARVLVMGLAFKENCPDVRNTKVVDIVDELKSYGADIDVHDPWVDPDDTMHEYGIMLTAEPNKGEYDVVILAVAHQSFRELGDAGIRAYGKPESVFFDIKYMLPADATDGRL